MSASAQAMMRSYAAHQWPEQNHKGRMRELSRRLGFGHRRVRALYQNEEGIAVRADEMARIQALKGAAADRENKDAFVALQARVSRLEAQLAAVDEAFFDAQMAGYRDALHVRRGADEPVVAGERKGE